MEIICLACGFNWELSDFWFKVRLRQKKLICPVCKTGNFTKKSYVSPSRLQKRAMENELWKKILMTRYKTFFKGKWDDDRFAQIKHLIK